jgi:hypothetical protein
MFCHSEDAVVLQRALLEAGNRDAHYLLGDVCHLESCGALNSLAGLADGFLLALFAGSPARDGA